MDSNECISQSDPKVSIFLESSCHHGRAPHPPDPSFTLRMFCRITYIGSSMCYSLPHPTRPVFPFLSFLSDWAWKIGKQSLPYSQPQVIT